MLSTQSVLLILLLAAYMMHVDGKIQNMPTESLDRNDYNISKTAKRSFIKSPDEARSATTARTAAWSA